MELVKGGDQCGRIAQSLCTGRGLRHQNARDEDVGPRA
jgi:hypothetical protein